MNGNLIYTDVVLQNNTGTSALIDEGCQCYAAINGDLAKGLGLSYISHETREIKGASSRMKSSNIEGVVAFRMEINGFHQTVYAYVVPGLAFPLILGNPWKAHNRVRTAPEKQRYYHGRAERWVLEGRNHQEQDDGGFTAVTASTSTENIEEAPNTKTHLTLEAPKTTLPPEDTDMGVLEGTHREQDDGGSTTVTALTSAETIEKTLTRRKHPTLEASKTTLPPEDMDIGVLEGRAHREQDGGGFTAVTASTSTDIEKALTRKIHPTLETLKKILPPEISDMAPLFSMREAEKLAPHRKGVDHCIEIRKQPDGTQHSLPWGPLYSMSKEELLVLRKSLDELLKKGYIRPSTSEAAAPVLFVRKPGGGLRFCCDYRALNAITKPDRYPLPLIPETLRILTGSSYLTKVDVVSAFHQVRMALGDEYKTAFRTRFGLFEWLVCPFGLSGAPATFQRYINSLLREHLDDCASAYIDDVIIYSNGSRKDHFRKVRTVLRKLWDGGLFLDPGKSEFAQKKIKYLGFIVHADGKGVGPDLEKVEAIQNWEAPKTQKEVRRFLGFANYYRTFIPNYSKIAGPLTALTGKATPFSWGKSEEKAFEDLKDRFCRAPVLSHWDPSLPTFLETDCSGFALGGALIQERDGVRRPVGFYSQKLNTAEINYDIHDKEMLAVVACLKFWEPELKACGSFTIWTDHKNLEYFMTKQKLSERQIRWCEALAMFQFSLVYRPGAEAILPDALSRREQDTLGEDDRLSRYRRFLEPDRVPNWPGAGERREVVVATTSILATLLEEESAQKVAESENTKKSNEDDQTGPLKPFQDEELNKLWATTVSSDTLYNSVLRAIENGSRTLPGELKVKIQAGDCSVDRKGYLRYRGKLWVPGAPVSSEADYNVMEPGLQLHDVLRTKLIQSVHDSAVYGHPGRDATASILGRDFYWPLQARQVRQFLRNCDHCGRNKVWREHKHGLLRPLPVPDRFFQEISMDFMTDLPNSEGNRYLWVIKDRLSKWVVLEAMPSMKAEECGLKFMDCWARHHGMPTAITSDRGTNWTSTFWKELCRLMGVKRRLSSAYHPQTDGGPERLNQEVQAYLRNFINHEQSDWKKWLSTAELALNARYHAGLGMSPFFATHGYEAPSPVALESEPAEGPRLAAAERATLFVEKMKKISDLCQANMAAAAQVQEESANRTRTPAPIYRKGDKVWLDLRNYQTNRPKRSLDAKHAKYTVAEVLSPVSVRLSGIPSNIHPVFHTDLIRLASQDPLPGQESDDKQPDPVIIDSHEEHHVEEILCARTKRRRREVLVKWSGYHELTWEPLHELSDNAAMDDFEKKYGDAQSHDGPREHYEKKTKIGKGTE